MMINFDKELSSRIPFWGVLREPRGTIIGCCKDTERSCEPCIFCKMCAVVEVKMENKRGV